MTTAAQSYSLSPSEAAKRLLMLDEARESLTSFVRAVQVPGKPVTDNPDEEYFLPVETTVAAHHLLLLQALERMCAKASGRLMVFMPPGSAKSTYASVVFPAWFLGARAGGQIILASYASDLARKQGRRTRQIVGSKRYRQIFETGLRSDSTAADEFALDNGSEYMSGGLLSELTGNRADGVVLDDPVSGREAAESEPIRLKTIDAFRDDLRSRLKPNAWIVLIQTRWHEDDLAGAILPEDWHGRKGLENNWTYPDNRIIHHPALRPGNYTFELMAFNSKGICSEIQSIDIIISPPFWQTWWFLLFAALLFLLLMYVLVQRRLNNIKSRHQTREQLLNLENQNLEAQKKQAIYERELVDIKNQALRLHMNPHFIFNAINSIQGFYASGDIEIARNYIGKFSTLLRLILDQSNKECIAIQEEIKTITLYLELNKLRFDNKFTYEIE